MIHVFANIEAGILLAYSVYMAILVIVFDHDPPFVGRWSK